MSKAAQFVVFSGVILLGAILGALVALYGAGEKRMGAFLAFAAGIMFGAAFFHMLPEALHLGGYFTFTFVPLGFICLFLLERYVLVHVCEEPPDCEEHVHNPLVGLTAFFGLSIHTLFDGIALGSAITTGVGAMAFTAIVAHKIPSSLALATILKSDRKSQSTVLLLTTLFGLMVPVGVGLYLLLSALLAFQPFAAHALSFSAGTFLYIAVSDLLPRVNRHGRERRLEHIVGLVIGLLVMFLLTLIPDHEHGMAPQAGLLQPPTWRF